MAHQDMNESGRSAAHRLLLRRRSSSFLQSDHEEMDDRVTETHERDQDRRQHNEDHPSRSTATSSSHHSTSRFNNNHTRRVNKFGAMITLVAMLAISAVAVVKASHDHHSNGEEMYLSSSSSSQQQQLTTSSARNLGKRFKRGPKNKNRQDDNNDNEDDVQQPPAPPSFPILAAVPDVTSSSVEAANEDGITLLQIDPSTEDDCSICNHPTHTFHKKGDYIDFDLLGFGDNAGCRDIYTFMVDQDDGCDMAQQVLEDAKCCVNYDAGLSIATEDSIVASGEGKTTSSTSSSNNNGSDIKTNGNGNGNSNGNGNNGGGGGDKNQGRKRDIDKDIAYVLNGNDITNSAPYPNCLYQHHFDTGTFIITTNHSTWNLCEDIEFAPCMPDLEGGGGGIVTDEEIAHAFDPVTCGGEKYNNNEYSLGYFAAVVIAAHDVTINLNGYTIQQHKSHALMQRFFAIFELASAPFLKDAGPANFVSETLVSASQVRIVGPGTVGLSSHHGIHGNGNVDVYVSNVIFRGFEVAAVSLNNVQGFKMEGCHVPHNNQDVPVLGSFSGAVKILPYVKYLMDNDADGSLYLRNEMTTPTTVYRRLVKMIANVYRDVMDTGIIDKDLHRDEFDMFDNPFRAVDGPCYAILIHGKGPAVGGTGFEMAEDYADLSSNVYLLNNEIQNIKCYTNEVPMALVADVDGESGEPIDVPVHDVRGAVLQFVNTLRNERIGYNENNKYVGNPLLDAQIMVGNAINLGETFDGRILQTATNKVHPHIVHWAEGRDTEYTPRFRCNGDSMHHAVKGSTMMRVEDTLGFQIKDNIINGVSILSLPGADTQAYLDLHGGNVVFTCADYHTGASQEDGNDQQLANLRGIGVAACSNKKKDKDTLASGRSEISGNILTNFWSRHATIIAGIDLQGVVQGVLLKKNDVDLNPDIGDDPTDNYCGLRVRRYSLDAQNIITDSNNFDEGIYYEDPVEDERRRLRGGVGVLPKNHPTPIGYEDEWTSEWVVGSLPGSCPMKR